MSQVVGKVGRMSIFDTGQQTYKSDLILGLKYKDSKTEIVGHLIALHFYEHACERGTLRYKDGDGNPSEATFDAPELINVETGETAQTKRTGGPDRVTGARSTPGR